MFKKTLGCLDFFGSEVKFTLDDSVKHSTWPGIIASVVCLAAMTSFTVVRTLKLVSREDPFFSTVTKAREDDLIDLGKLGFMFAIEKIIPEYGIIYANHITWGSDNYKDGKKVRPIELVSCEELLPGGSHEGQVNSDKWDIKNFFRGIKGPEDFLCPVGIESLEVAGEFIAPQFKYAEIVVKGCQLEEGCADDTTVSKRGLNIVILSAEPDPFGNSIEDKVYWYHNTQQFFRFNPTQ